MQKLRIFHSATGSALVLAVVIGTLLAISGTMAISLLSRGSELHGRDQRIIKSYWANEGALRLCYRYLSRTPVLPTTTITDFLTSPELVINNDTPAVTIQPIATAGGTNVYTIQATTHVQGTSLNNVSTCERIAISGLSRYTLFQERSMFTSNWNAKVIDGDFHINGYIKLSRDMTNVVHVTGKATCASNMTRPNIGPSLAPYNKGIGFGQTDGTGFDDGVNRGLAWFQARLPDYAHAGRIDNSFIVDLSSAYDPGINAATHDRAAVYIDGTDVSIYRHNGSGWHLHATRPASGIITLNLPTYVGGTLNGQLTIATTNGKNIIIGDNILYANTDLTTSDDVLGLVSGNDVVIPTSFNHPGMGLDHNFKANGGTIYASVFAKDGMLKVQNYSSYPGLRHLNIHGSMLVNDSSPTKSSSNKGIVAHYLQDPRFKENTAMAPGIGTARQTDEEMAGEFMNILASGTWRNTVVHD